MSLDFDPNNFTDILTKIGMELPSDLVVTDFKDFGKMTSHIYRAKFFTIISNLMKTQAFDAKSVAPIVYFATLIKNKKRIIDGLNRLASKYKDAKWFKDTVLFYNGYSVQYVTDMDRSTEMVFPVVNIPTMMPNVAAHFFKQHLKRDGVVRNDAKMLEDFMHNLWFCQLRIESSLMEEHKNWEREFWNNTVKKTKNTDTEGFKANRGFQEDFYMTKAADDYQFIDAGRLSNATYTKDAVLAWLKKP